MSQFEPASILREDIMNGVARGLSLGLSSRDWLTPANPATLEFVHHWLDVHELRENEMHLSGRGREILAKPMSIREAFVHYAKQVHQKDGALSWVALWQEPPPRSLMLSDTSAASDWKHGLQRYLPISARGRISSGAPGVVVFVSGPKRSVHRL